MFFSLKRGESRSGSCVLPFGTQGPRKAEGLSELEACSGSPSTGALRGAPPDLAVPVPLQLRCSSPWEWGLGVVLSGC